MNKFNNKNNQLTFNCYRHPEKFLEAVCTEPVCNHYRFFCVTCFLENSSHLLNHKNYILEIPKFLSLHQNSLVRTSGVQEIDNMITQIKQYMKEYEVLITQKSLGYSKVFQEIEKRFEDAKQNCLKEVQNYLQILVEKQNAHYTYLKKKVDTYKQELNFQDISFINNTNEQEFTYYFESMIKNHYNQHKEFKQEVKMYTTSFQKNIYDLDNVDSSKVIEICMEEMEQQFKQKFNELKEVLVVPNEEHLSFLKNSKIKMENQQNNYIFQQQLQQQQQQQMLNLQSKLSKSNIFNNNMMQNNKINEKNMIHINTTQGLSSNFQSNSKYSTNNNFQQNQQAYNIEFENQDLIEDSASAYNKKQNQDQFNNSYLNSHLNFFQSSVNTNISNNNLFQNQNNNIIQNPYMENFQKPNPKPKGKQNKTQKKINLIQQTDSEIEMESENENDMKTYQKNFNQVQNGKISSKIYQAQSVKNQSINQKSKNIQSTTHSEGITCILQYDVIQDKQIIATGSLDKTIRLWNLNKTNFNHIKTLVGHNSPITCMIKFERQDINFLVSGDSQHEIKIWNPSLSGNELITTLIGHYQGGITSLAYMNNYLLSSSQDSTIKVWNMNDLKCVQTLELDQYSLCLSCSDQLLIASSLEGFRIYNFINDLESGNIFKLQSYNNCAHRCGIQKILQINSNGIDMATSGKDGLIKLWNLQEGGCIKQLKQHNDSVYDMVYLNDKLFTSGRDGLKVFNLDGECLHEGNNNHKFVRDDILGQIIIIPEFECALSVGNGDAIIKIIPL